MLIGLAGGLGIFLFGIHLMSEGMRKSAGERMRTILGTLTHDRFVAVGVGSFITMIIQSSSATTVLLVSFVQAGLLTFPKSLGVILGAHIGTTITAQVIAFRLTDYALLVVALGALMVFLGQRQNVRNVGEAILGFGLLFFGMHIMSEAMHPLRSYAPFVQLLVQLEMPVLGILVGAAFTALIQSSSAFTGILIILGSQGLLTLEAAIPLIFGANIGTCITAFLASLNTRREAKRVALAHILFQVFGVLLFVWWITPFAAAVRWISPAGAAGLAGTDLLAQVLPRQIANAHTLFNVMDCMIALPFLGPAARLIEWLLPDVKGEGREPFVTQYLDDSILPTPELALNLATREVVRMGETVRAEIGRIAPAFLERQRAVLAEWERTENEVNFLDERISTYLTRISRQNISLEASDEVFRLMYTVTELEQIADIIYKNIMPRAREWLATKARFSPQGEQELRDFHLATIKQVSRALNLLQSFSVAYAQKMRRKHEKYRRMEFRFIRTHYQRLRDLIPETLSTREYHQELMEQLLRIDSHATNIARILLEAAPAPPRAAG